MKLSKADLRQDVTTIFVPLEINVDTKKKVTRYENELLFCAEHSHIQSQQRWSFSDLEQGAKEAFDGFDLEYDVGSTAYLVSAKKPLTRTFLPLSEIFLRRELHKGGQQDFATWEGAG